MYMDIVLGKENLMYQFLLFCEFDLLVIVSVSSKLSKNSSVLSAALVLPGVRFKGIPMALSSCKLRSSISSVGN